jgi:hypothetical protein
METNVDTDNMRSVIGLIIVAILISCTILYARLMMKLGRKSIFYTADDLPLMLASPEFYLIIILTLLGCFLMFFLKAVS